jgi:hypothetical protein
MCSKKLGAINRTDMENLKEMLKELGPLSRILNIPMNIIEKALLLLKEERNRAIRENSSPMRH